MERLTKYVAGVAHGAEGRTAESLNGSYCRGEFEATAIVDRLAAYEDTGLEPEEIEQLKGEVFGLRLDKQELSALGPIDRLRELAQADSMSSKILFPTFNVSLGQAINIVKTGLADESISLKTRVLAIDHVAHMETHNSITKDELVEALRWLFDHYDFEED